MLAIEPRRCATEFITLSPDSSERAGGHRPRETGKCRERPRSGDARAATERSPRGPEVARFSWTRGTGHKGPRQWAKSRFLLEEEGGNEMSEDGRGGGEGVLYKSSTRSSDGALPKAEGGGGRQRISRQLLHSLGHRANSIKQPQKRRVNHRRRIKLEEEKQRDI